MDGVRVIIWIAAAVVGGCALPNPYRVREPEPPARSPESEVRTQGIAAPEVTPATPLPPTPPAARPRVLSAPSKVLVAQAQAQLNAGDAMLAAATLERALRIEPDNPLLWIELAKIREASGDSVQAENLARKALTMAAGDPKAQAEAWRVIAASYRSRGLNPEARAADAKASAIE